MKRMGAMALMMLLLAGCAGGGTAPAGTAETKAAPVTSGSLYVSKVEGLGEDFILGADVSSLLSEEASGVVYRNFSGEPQDMLQTLAENGVNYVRVRVWVDPFDRDGHG